MIGSGNLATHLSLALQRAGHDILQVYSRTEEHARLLAERLGCDTAGSTDAIRTDADAYIFAVKDDAIGELATAIGQQARPGIMIHTAGSVPMSIFQGKARHYGVLYPMQTFSKNREVDFRPIPCFIEASDAQTLDTIQQLAEGISEKVVEASSERRRKLHLAAVLACNLTNHCYRLAERVLEEEQTDFQLFLPLIMETARKVTQLSPREAQTGPMVRYDTQVMERQMQLLSDERTRQIYRLMAESIHEDVQQSK
jgi:predicted short-subunit dehydrogenase-like oxidoreductase (DUF2520 family)